MITLEDIKISLDSNTNFNDELKDNIFGLIHLFNSKYPEISLEYLNNNLKTLQIVKSSKYVNERISKYNHLKNILELNVERIGEGYDMQHVMMSALLNILTNNGEQTGFNNNNRFEALNAGYTEILSNNLVGNDSKIDIKYLEDEIISTNMVAIMVGNDAMFEAYFKNDAAVFVKKLVNEGAGV